MTEDQKTESDYEIQNEPEYAVRSRNWKVAIGLQQVDRLVPSEYLIDTANQNIEGMITVGEARERIDRYYEAKDLVSAGNDRTEEADKVSARIAELLSPDSFALSPAELKEIHRHLFHGIYEHAGKIRDMNISKKEWILNGRSVLYCSAASIRETMEYDIGRERNFDYSALNMNETVKHAASFISGLWQVHPFFEGNTRTMAVFAIKYLRKLGFRADNDAFEKNSWYFRNALVRANYSDLKNGIHQTAEYLNRFFGNLLLDESNELNSRDLRI